MPSDTKARIQEVARELFLSQGVQNTSLRQISERLGITKPALYYHFSSRDDLVRSIVQPMVEDIERFVTTRRPGDPRALLGEYFELAWRHRDVITMMIRDVTTLGVLDLGTRMFDWRRRLITLLLGSDLTQEQRIRATVALGGLSDCSVEYAHLPMDEVKPAAVEAAAAALGL
ncbi:TetR family transcriptional regulator [Nonomuraea phyllanthi]|uniref:TetR family transcriptional regulator n=1 Tax=Nonomuraea phyllanthi TaxID=2219224 RepID=A0A5C4VLS7_9ACTN|nr:TetR/AcrR family transcriptional regulator [Nonomuraea phyllanthi]KAB8189379.1 TetR family transcriptional regulator [Nonomuraea phyllanthi]QFY11706.1 TetR family transcriptional regulator [Nonomuraea phyllanthi]